MTKKICIIGPGAIGGLLGALFAQAGADVSILGRPGRHLDAIRSQGLRLEWQSQTLRQPVRATARPGELGEQDYVIIATKTTELTAVAGQIAPLLGSATAIVSAINGVPWWFLDGFGGPLHGQRLRSIDPDGSLLARLPSERIIGCVIHLSSSVAGPGLIRHGIGNRFIIGESSGSLSDRCRQLASLFADADLECQLSTDIRKAIWEKLLGNMNFNPISALTGATVDRIATDPLLRQLCADIMLEAKAVGEAIGIHTPITPEERIGMALKLGAFKTSMLQDVESGKPLEIDALLGVIHEMAERLGLPCPNIGAVLGLVRLKAACSGSLPPP